MGVIITKEQLALQIKETLRREAELILANSEIAFQIKEKEERAAELIVANKELIFENKEKEKRAAELAIANEELVFQDDEKGKRAAELLVANRELVFENEEKGKRAAELLIANEELSFQNEEKEKRAAELVIANTELAFQNKEKEKRAAELIIANKELVFENKEKEKRAAELLETLEQVSFLATIAENIQDPVITSDHNSIITRWNHTAEKLFEWKSEEAIGRTTAELLHTIYPQETRGQIFESIQNDGIWSGEVVLHTKSGRALNMLATASHLKDFRGNVTGNLFVVRDITARKMAEEALSKLNAELEHRVIEKTETIVKTFQEKNMILESIGDAFFAIDKNGIVTYWNRIAEITLGVNKLNIINKNLWETFSESINSLSYIKYQEAITTNQVVHFEDYYTTLQKWYEISAYPSENGLSVFFKDISERKQAEEEIKSLNEELEKRVVERTEKLMIANKDLEQFAYVASHDLQEPLRTVSNYMKIFEEDYVQLLGENGIKYIHSVNNAIRRMSVLIKSLLDFSRLGHNTKLTCADCKKVIDDVLEDLDIAIQKSGTIIEVSEMPTIHIYETELRQVFQNLITNAIKFRKKNTVPKIRIASDKIDVGWKFSVSDNGIGIDPVHYHQVFDIFQRLETKEKYEGSGIGLANCKKIVQLHQGEIWIEPNPEQGCTFCFTVSNELV